MIYSLSLLLLAQLQDPTYKESYEVAINNDKPIVVFISANWCPGCRSYRKVFDEYKKNNNDNVYAYVYEDVDRKTFDLLAEGVVVPQTIMFVKRKGVWYKKIMIGNKSLAELKEFIDK